MCDFCGDETCEDCYDEILSQAEFEWYLKEVTKAFLEKQIFKPTEH
jgi:hypothetical protein